MPLSEKDRVKIEELKKEIEKEKGKAKTRKEKFFKLVGKTDMTRKTWIDFLETEALQTKLEMEEDKDLEEI